LGLTNVHFEKDTVCSACQAGKQVGTNHPHKNIMTTNRPLELLHMDLFGPIAYISIGGSKYCLVIVDDYSRFTWVLFLQEKSQTQETLKGFLRRAQNEFGLRIKKIRRILSYLFYTPKFGLWYPKGSTFDLIGYSDADWEGCKLIRRAHQGLVSFWEDPWCHGLQRNKTPYLFPPPKPSTLTQAIVVCSYFG
jgi:hypothetical protein